MYYFYLYTASLSQARFKLQKATYKSDLSSTEDDVNIEKKFNKIRSFSTSPHRSAKPKKVLSQPTGSCPPRFKDFISGMYVNNQILIFFMNETVMLFMFIYFINNFIYSSYFNSLF